MRPVESGVLDFEGSNTYVDDEPRFGSGCSNRESMAKPVNYGSVGMFLEEMIDEEESTKAEGEKENL